ncbi:decaprenyl-phosphate phosphoribosyltransferase [Pseudoflavitalea sp. G-6-1-2]|uniref:decaprenyl-phosphate phosphoribosyltransferase n=1 Tax=Pseudoflavitalea sp. G-6-1-2 TaxID=2728841 RepID=UPI00146DCD8B|nr:decaprenyl-phosphate phosphoribosyltransferase [Pseudoflavitalea sp. G-6-1-2]NML20736.1 decaprenyl-phosphate phosphoribosyltransferase [Pseudoflavitalea sp. G-6-1-2]
MLAYIKLLRPKDWAKNLFLFVPSFFAGKLFDLYKFELLLGGFAAFSFLASSIYIINDYRDIESDRKHPEKRKRPLAAGTVNKITALIIAISLFFAGMLISYLLDSSGKFLFVTSLYYVLNLGYSFGLKNVSIVDIIIVAAGFVLRVKGGSVLSEVDLSQWLTIMTFLLALFMAIAKRRDDVVLKSSTGEEMRKSMKGYSLEFLNMMLGLFCAILIVTYINYTVSSGVLYRQFGHRLYYTSLFVIAGIMRYLQITFIQNKAGSPTEILYKDRFIQITLLLWIASFYFILYMKDVTIFDK